MIQSIFGRFSDRKRHYQLLRTMPDIRQSIENIRQRWDVSEAISDQKPIFIFSAGWRSGSTLLQRLVLSDPKLLIWGEPYAHSDLIRKLADGLRAFEKGVPADQFFIDHYLSDEDSDDALSSLWVANLYPMPSDLIKAHRNFWTTLFCDPATTLGFSRWGVKEVRLSAEYAIYLRFIFPDAKFIFLYRNPYDAYRSYKTFRSWYDVWPTQPVFTPRQFGNLWRTRLTSFLNLGREVEAYLVSYEEIVSDDHDFSQLANYLEIDLDASVAGRKIEGVRLNRPERLPWLDRVMLSSSVEPLASEMGYQR